MSETIFAALAEIDRGLARSAARDWHAGKTFEQRKREWIASNRANIRFAIKRHREFAASLQGFGFLQSAADDLIQQSAGTTGRVIRSHRRRIAEARAELTAHREAA